MTLIMRSRLNYLPRSPLRPAFTLIELLVVMMIISLLASTMLFAMYGAIEDAKAARTRAQITKLNDMIMTRYESYRTRAVRLALTPAARRNGRVAARARLDALRDLMRMEMPDRTTDVTDPPELIPIPIPGHPSVQLAIPSLLQEYRRRATQNGTRSIGDWSGVYQGSECLYMIIASIRDLDSNGLDFLHEGEIGDLDGDGMPEILDAWGRPIAFIRWPSGFVAHPGDDVPDDPSDLATLGVQGGWGVTGDDDDGNGQTDDYAEAGWPGTNDIPSYGALQRIALDTNDPNYVVAEVRDPFDPLRVDHRPGQALSSDSTSLYYFNFAIYPLICSSGPDQRLDLVLFDYQSPDIDVEIPFSYYRVVGPVRNDPYSIMPNSNRRLGEPFIESFGYADNIHNHALGDE